MRNTKSEARAIVLIAAGTLGLALAAAGAARLDAKQRKVDVPAANDFTSQLFQLLDNSYGGKLPDTYILADFYQDPTKPGQELRHVLRVEYDKSRAFGRLKIYVRGVVKMTPQQLQTYTAKDAFDFGETDLEKFVKSSPGPFGAPGDVYLVGGTDEPLTSQTITDSARKTYDMYVTQYIMPDLEKKSTAPPAAPSSSGRL
jgi:hypothetical protein